MAARNRDKGYVRETDITSEISAHERVRGDVYIGHGLRLAGVVRGNVEALGTDSNLIIAASGRIEGRVKVARIRIDGAVKGSLHVDGHVEITASAVIEADIITYGSISIESGAHVDAQLQCRHADFNEYQSDPNADPPDP